MSLCRNFQISAPKVLLGPNARLPALHPNPPSQTVPKTACGSTKPKPRAQTWRLGHRNERRITSSSGKAPLRACQPSSKLGYRHERSRLGFLEKDLTEGALLAILLQTARRDKLPVDQTPALALHGAPPLLDLKPD